MIRAVLAVSLSLALVGLSVPAIEEARETRSEKLVRGELDDLVATAHALVDSEDAIRTDDPARRIVSVSLPKPSPTTAGIEYVSIEEDVLAYRIDGGRERTLRTPVSVETREDDPIVLRQGGTHRLALSLVGGEEAAIVVEADV